MKESIIVQLKGFEGRENEMGSFTYYKSQEVRNGAKIYNYGSIYKDGISMSLSINEYHKHAERQMLRMILGSSRDKQSGLSHPIYGHMNKHYLRMKYKNKLT